MHFVFDVVGIRGREGALDNARTHIGAKWYAKGDFIQECSKQVHISLVYGYEVSNSLGGHSEPP